MQCESWAVVIRNVFIVLLALAAIATVGLGAASYVTPLAATIYRNESKGTYLGVRAERGMLGFYSWWCVPGKQRAPVARSWGHPFVGMITYDFFPAPKTYHVSNRPGGSYSVSFSYSDWPPVSQRIAASCVVSVHFGSAFGLLAAYPALAFIRGPLRRHRRRRKGLCLKCAYDLKGNVSGVCPECGKKTRQP